LKSRRPKTKFLIVKVLVELGMGWHSFKDIRKSAMEHGVSVSHLFENLIELYRKSVFLESDFKKKYYPNIEKLRDVKDGKRLMKILDEFEGYYKKEFWEEEEAPQ